MSSSREKWTVLEVDRMLDVMLCCDNAATRRRTAQQVGMESSSRRSAAAVEAMLWKVPTRYGFWKDYHPQSRRSRRELKFTQTEKHLLNIMFNPKLDAQTDRLDKPTLEYASRVLCRTVEEIEAYVQHGRRPLGVF